MVIRGARVLADLQDYPSFVITQADDSPAIDIAHSGNDHGLVIAHESLQTDMHALVVTSLNTDGAAIDVEGVPTSKGIITVMHNHQTGVDESSASILSLWINSDGLGEGGSAQGIYIDSDEAHTGNLLNLRNNGQERLKLLHGGQLQLAVSGSGAGIRIGGDVDLYRSAANVLFTPDQLHANDGLITKVVAGTPDDSDYAATPAAGALAVDSTNKELYFRYAATKWRSTSNKAQKRMKALGYVSENFPVEAAAAATAMTSGTPIYAAIYLEDGDVVTNIYFRNSPTITQPDAFYVGLYLGTSRLAVSADLDTTIGTTSGLKTCPLSAPYTVPDGGEGLYYLAFLTVLGAGTQVTPNRAANVGSFGLPGKLRPWAADTATGLSALPVTASFTSGSIALWAAVN